MNFKCTLHLKLNMFLYILELYVNIQEYLLLEEMEILYQICKESYSFKKSNIQLKYKYLEYCTPSTFRWCLQNELSIQSEIFKYLSWNIKYSTSIFQYISRKTHIRLLNTRNIAEYASVKGNLSLIKWLNDNNLPWKSKLIFRNAANNGYLNVIRFAHVNKCNWDLTSSYRAAIGGHIHVLKWIKENGYEWSRNTCSAAAIKGYLHILIWLKENGCPWGSFTFSKAASYGNLNILKWLCRQNPPCPWDPDTCLEAVRADNLDVLKWLKTQDYTFNRYICEEAGKTSNLKILKWLFEQEFEFTKRVFTLAALKGQMAVLKWLREVNCPWDEYTFLNICNTNNLDLVIWAKK